MTAQTTIQPVILCGGAGTRLWPLSRTGFPKQFLCLTGGESLYQQAVRRVTALETDALIPAQPLIVTGEEHRFLALEQLREIDITPKNLLLEPAGRNTAPALTLAALAARADGDDPTLVVTPADQSVTDSAAFTSSLHTAIRQAQEGGIVTLGVAPRCPETGYGYIQTQAPCSAPTAQSVVSFVEKPDLATAQRYLDAGTYYWNAGLFVLKASVWLQAIETFRPDIFHPVKKSWDGRVNDHSAPFIRPERDHFTAVPAESIDYAVMERCLGGGIPVHMVPLDAGWGDLGAWDAVWTTLPKDDQGNAQSGDVLTTASHNNLVHATHRLVSLVGVKNLVVVETADAVLVADKTQAQDVKDIVNRLHHHNRDEQILHRKVYRPWGWYDTTDSGERFKVKRIHVKPGASLSLQRHHHRAEHWVVVKGTAEVTTGDNVNLLTENQSSYIPLGSVHRLKNPGMVPLEIIEVQSGHNLREDDIVRLDDEYERHK